MTDTLELDDAFWGYLACERMRPFATPKMTVMTLPPNTEVYNLYCKDAALKEFEDAQELHKEKENGH